MPTSADAISARTKNGNASGSNTASMTLIGACFRRGNVAPLRSPNRDGERRPAEPPHPRDVPGGARKGPVDGLGLGQVRDASRSFARRLAERFDRAGPGLQDPGYQLEQCCLATAVWAEDREEGAALDVETHVVED